MQIRFMPAFGGKPPKRKKAIEKTKKTTTTTTRTQTEAEKMASKIGSLSCAVQQKTRKKDKYVVCYLR